MTARRLPTLFMLVVIESACGGVVKPPPCGSGPLRWRPIAEPQGVDMQFWEHCTREGPCYAAVWNEDRVWFWGGDRGARAF